MERLTKDGRTLNYDKKYFTDENEAQMFSDTVNGSVYPVDFLGGYEVVFQSEPEMEDNELEMDI
ncbi:hypothetical protein [uncultured Clostridium sp.]|uniref:hypothetical protein n=1 Tax=uncultured Clostridium sp. TaxID=59620 RepID=UPI00272D24A9|nr:hypothetical protein [uncultured Clostridium sp.]